MNKPVLGKSAELCLFCLEKDINILFNPESQAFCNISAEIKEQLLTLAAAENESGIIAIEVPHEKIKNPGDFKNLFLSLKIGKFVKIQDLEQIDARKFKEGRITPP